jgi:nucleoside-diphosphate-sugar epimerase
MTGCVAVTGATGLLGRSVLRSRTGPVRALVRPGTAPPAGVEVVVGDLADVDALARLVDGADAVLHLATAMGSADDATMDAVNVEGTRRLLAAAGDRRFVFTSSVAARDPTLGAYAASKARAEALVLEAGGVVLRLPVLYGPGTQVEAAVLGLGRRLPLVPALRGADLRPLHIDDAAAACLAALEAGEGRYTLAGPDAVSFPGFARRLLRAAGARARVLPLPAGPLIAVARAGSRLWSGFPVSSESLRAAASGTPAADARVGAELGVRPRSLAEGLARR